MENTPVIKSTPKDVFLHLFNILTFYLSVIGFITLYVQYLNALLPDALDYYFTGIAETVRVASSILLIAVPAYLLTAWLLAKDITAEPQKHELRLRKWLVYFTLFISAITIIIDLITFVYNFLSGEITTRFFLKILVVLLVAGAVFGYYMWDLKRTEMTSKIPKYLGTILLVLAFGSVIGGFFVVGTPVTQRNRRFDEQRINNLQMIQGQITNYWTLKAVLPTSTNDLQDNISGFVVPKDPENNLAYGYKVVDQNSFELCATFKTISSDLANPKYQMYSPYDVYNQNWNHKAERTCFSRKIDPELYKTTTSNGEVVPVPVKEIR
ncbi:MAG: hypothetical protein ACD_72C00097G0006 [uncultured bacterium]|nr:MAG: hypothetical protein ACD_72C00097G0006 [uncultured bacterium]